MAWGRWVVDDLVYECVLAPSGDNSSVVLIAVPASELHQQQHLIDDIILNLEGVSEAMPHFSLLAWRLGSLFLWMALALALHAANLRFVDQDDDHATAGRRASLMNLGLVALGSGAAYLVLAPRQLALVHAGSTVMEMTVWIVVAGIFVVGAHFLIASRFERGRVQSAPASGAFASGIYSRTDMIRASRSEVRTIPRELAESSGSWSQVGNPAAPRSELDSDTGPIDLDRRK